jgi:hypothetical protein
MRMAKKPRLPLQELIDRVWEKAAPVRGTDVRRPFANEIYPASCGNEGENSRDIEHLEPVHKDDAEDLPSLQPLQTEANQEIGDKRPVKPGCS